MAAIMGGGDGMGALPLEQWFFEMPVCTRWWTTATVATGILVQCQVLTPFQLFYSFRAVFHKQQFWRLITTFIYFGPLSLNLVFHIFFIQRYARMLEESAASVAHFSYMLAYTAITLLVVAQPLFNQAFLGTTLSSTLVYIWARRNPDTRLSFLGLLTFTAPWLPWVLIAFNVVLHGHWPKDELCGIAVGHVVYFFNDIYPSTHNGHRPLDPPQWWISLFERRVQPTPGEDVHAAALNRDIAAPAVPHVG
ncbi:Putative derlin, Rhomboid-like superfamily [Septoria linicola]|uniref:Derlin n=1 Tax=Septoria linicola TaxID=215465 RepID=A0A9Q9ALU0_9PEZI|nr:putative derlin, Rhomboid-like superfamily [Septoria linicola]USW51679.1 Putative derlin, Rhomboid-like superfamily [Septoria linicola]